MPYPRPTPAATASMNPRRAPRSSRTAKRLPVAMAAALLFAGTAQSQVAPAQLPVQANTPGRNATVGPQTGTSGAPVMNITQTGARGVLEWQSFSIGAAATVNIQQTNAQSVLVNRVTGVSAPASQILGAMNANGRVFLINPAGITFGAGAQVQVGSLVATTLDLAPGLVADNYNALVDPKTTTLGFVDAGFAGGPVVEAGATLRVGDGGSLVLVGRDSVTHSGAIEAIRGRIAMGAGSGAQVVLPASDSGFIDLVVTAPAAQAADLQLTRGSTVLAEGGSVRIGNGQVGLARQESIRVDGEINVGSDAGAAGSIVVDAGPDGTAELGGDGFLAAVSTGAGQQGGSITLTGGTVTLLPRFSGEALVSVPTTKAAAIVIPAVSNAIDASGTAGGGTVILGGATTKSIYIGQSNDIVADALTNGAGGLISVRADFEGPASEAPVPRIDFGVTEVYGSLRARGGIEGGNGGRIETAGRALTLGLDEGAGSAPLIGTVDGGALAAGAAGGLWVAEAPSLTVSSSVPFASEGSWFPDGPVGLLLGADLSRALDTGTRVELTTGAANAAVSGGSITVVDTSITRSAGTVATTLTLRAHEGIGFVSGEGGGPTIGTQAGAGALNVELFSDSNGDGSGGVTLASTSVTTGGGGFTVSGGLTPATGFARGGTGPSGVAIGNSNIDTSTAGAASGAIVLRGQGGLDTAENGVSVSGSFLFGGSIAVDGRAANGSGVSVSGSTLQTDTGLLDVRGVATRTSADGNTAVGVDLSSASLRSSNGSIRVAGRGDDGGIDTTAPAATGLRYGGLQVTTGPNTTGSIELYGEAARSTGAGITFRDVESGGLRIYDFTSTDIPTLASVSLGAVSSNGLAFALGLEANPDAVRVSTQASINFRAVGVDVNGIPTEAVGTPLTLGTAGERTSGFFVDSRTFGAAFQAGDGFVVGSSAHTGAITAEADALTGLNGEAGQSITLQNQGAGAAGIRLDGAVQVRDLGLLTSGDISQAAPLAIDRDLVLSSNGTATLATAGNTVGGTLAFTGTSNLTFVGDGSVVVGSGAGGGAIRYDAGTRTFSRLVLTGSTAGASALVQSSNGTVTATHGIAAAGQLDLVSPVSVTAAGVGLSAATGSVQAWAPVINWTPEGRLNLYGCVFPACTASGITPPGTGLQALFPDRPTLTVTANAAAGPVGAVPPLTFGAAGFVNGDTVATALAGALATPAAVDSPAGTYAIQQGSLASPTGYLIQYTGAELILTGAVVPPPPPPPPPNNNAFLADGGREMVRTAFLSEVKSDVYGRNRALPLICTAQSTTSEAVARDLGSDPLASEWGKVRHQPQLSACLDVGSGGQCAAF